MSGGEPSSIKQYTRCAVRSPAWSRRCEDRVDARFDFKVYGLISGPFGFAKNFKEVNYASSVI